MNRALYFIPVLLLASTLGSAQGYVSYFTGDTTDAVAAPLGGVCLMGGAGEDDQAMTWFLERVNGGDVLVLRASGSDGYNDYLFSELGVEVNSVETVVFSDAAASELPEIHARIAQAEGIWFAGGDQWDYVSFWRGTPVAEWINEGIADRNIVVGGISAGMAILGQFYFSAMNGTVTSEEALAAPYAAAVTVDSARFLEVPHLERVVTDTHYNDPDRKGRHTAFLARCLVDYGVVTRGMACDEYAAICIDEAGIARVFGEYPDYDDTAYFIAPNCELSDATPEGCAPNAPLDWNRGGEALNVYEVKGTPAGSYTFDLNSWQSGSGGTWRHWHVAQGGFNELDGTEPACAVSVGEFEAERATVHPNPATDWVHIPWIGGDVHVFNGLGQSVHVPQTRSAAGTSLDCSGLPDGWYHVTWNGFMAGSRLLVRH